jgi:hypothetical protein
MKRFLQFGLAAFFSVAAGAGQSFAFQQEVNNIWWALFDNYNWSNQTACVAENYNNHAVTAVFELFPVAFDPYGNPLPRRMVITLQPYQFYKLYSWANVPGPGPRCELRSSTLRIQ